ncbi:MAG TPA: hypothetical protein VLD86_08410, partial [Ilumatobacteraceae bacterium]|nr:hypothetical protein [Ilumatobacteraceae bacterium]
MSGASVAFECAVRRTRTRKGRASAVVAAIAIGIAGLLLVSVASTIAGDRALQRGVADLDPEARAFTASFAPDVTPSSEQLETFNAAVAARMTQRGLGPTLRTVEYRALAAGDGRVVRFAGLDGLREVTRLIEGAWPARCDAQRCEVIALVDDPSNTEPVAQLPTDSALGLTVVGTAVATNDLVLNGQLRPDSSEVIMLADGVGAASALPALQLFRRTYAWQTPIIADDVRSIDIDPLLAGVRNLANDPQLVGLHVSGPEDELGAVVSRTRITGSRLAVPVGALLVLFFGVAAVAGLGGRADHRRAAWVLRRRGADGRAIAVFRVLEAGFPVVVGAAVGVIVAAAVGAWLGGHTGLGSWSLVRRSFDGSVAVHVVEVSLAVLLLIVAVLSVGDRRLAGRRRVLPSDIAGVAALAVLLVLVGRGSISTSSLARRVDPTLVAVPVLAAIAVAAVVVRVVPLVLRVCSNGSPRHWPLARLTLSEATAQPLRSIAAASLIAVTVMFALLTFGYASTLRLGSRDQAAFAVPYDFRLQLGAQLVRPQALVPEGGWQQLAAGTTSTDVLRRGVAVRLSASNVQTVEVLGLDPSTLRSLHGWRDGFGPDPERLADDIDRPATSDLGSPLPADGVSIEFVGTGFEGL